MKIRPRRIYVWPDFEKKLKILAIEKNKSVVTVTKELAVEDFSNIKNKLIELGKPKEKKNEKDIFRY